MKKEFFFAVYVIFTHIGVSASDWTETLPLTDRILYAAFDDGYIQHYGYHHHHLPCNYNFPLDISKAMQAGVYNYFKYG
jgi:hypothetical protein